MHGRSRITTWTGEGEPRRRTLRRGGRRARPSSPTRCATSSGVGGDERVATLMWNNAEHVEAYFAIPSMGAVLHTLNLRLPAEQLVWIVNHAADRVIIVNGSLLPLLAPLLPQLPTVEHVVVVGPGDRSLLDGCRARGARLRGAARRPRPTTLRLAGAGRAPGRGHVLHLRHHRRPQGRASTRHRSIYLHSMQVNIGRVDGPDRAGTPRSRSSRSSTSTPGACRTPPS